MNNIEAQDLRRDLMPRKSRRKAGKLMSHAELLHILVLKRLDESPGAAALDHQSLMNQFVHRSAHRDTADAVAAAHIFLQLKLLSRRIISAQNLMTQILSDFFILHHDAGPRQNP